MLADRGKRPPLQGWAGVGEGKGTSSARVDREHAPSHGGAQEGGHEGFAAYSSAQFMVSRAALWALPRELYLQMLLAINGSDPLSQCSLSTNAAVGTWGGHQLTGQYERMWHVLFGKPRRQSPRSKDGSLPVHLRVDCLPLQAGRCQEELTPLTLTPPRPPGRNGSNPSDRSSSSSRETLGAGQGLGQGLGLGLGQDPWDVRGREGAAKKLKEWRAKQRQRRETRERARAP